MSWAVPLHGACLGDESMEQECQVFPLLPGMVEPQVRGKGREGTIAASQTQSRDVDAEMPAPQS